MLRRSSLLVAFCIALLSCSGNSQEAVAPAQSRYGLLIRNGTLYDGSGGGPFVADIAVDGDRIVTIGSGLGAAEVEVDATGLAVAPGFINVLSWATFSLVEDGRSVSDIRQGVTLEVMGEGWSMGPLNARMKREVLELQGDIRFDIEWTTLGEYLRFLQDRGVSTNVASFVGATTVRVHELGYEDRPPNADELARMQVLVRSAMQEGALGVGSSLIYAPGFYAGTDELVALGAVAAEYGGRYISHIRSEGNTLLEAIGELIEIARRAGIGAEIYHLKASGERNWSKLGSVFERIEQARAEGLDITADMYTYTAGATELTAAMPPWVQEGGLDAWVERLRDPAIRKRLQVEMTTPTDAWENLYLDAGGAENVILIGFKNPQLKHLTGKTVAEVAELRGTSPEVAMMDLVVEDHSPVSAVYFVMSEANVRAKIAQPWMSFGSDEASLSPEGVFLEFNPHPRAYGNFARLLGKYVRDEGIISLEEAIRRLTSLPAKNLKIRERGLLKAGYFADIVVFDPAAIQDHASYDEPHQLSAGVTHVFVNGEAVLRDGEHTGATPGRFVRGPGWSGNVDLIAE
jgi:N-acyl-D-amino-acid deacylase